MRFWYLNPVCLAGFAWVVCRRIPVLIFLYWPRKPSRDVKPEYWTTTAEGLQRFAQAIREANRAGRPLSGLFIGALIGFGVLAVNWIASPGKEEIQTRIEKDTADIGSVSVGETRVVTTRAQFDAAVNASDIGDVVSIPSGTYTSWGNVIFPDPPKGKIAFSNNVFRQGSVNTVIDGKGGNEIYNNTFFACSSSECTTGER